LVTTQVLQKKELTKESKMFVKEKHIYIFAPMEEMISIRRSEYEQFLSQQEELRGLRDLVRQLREDEDIELFIFQTSYDYRFSRVVKIIFSPGFILFPFLRYQSSYKKRLKNLSLLQVQVVVVSQKMNGEHTNLTHHKMSVK
jgi:hypothetical protein